MSTINLKTLPPIVPGMAYARTLQGNTPAGVAATGFTSDDTITATLSSAQGLPSLFSPTVTWSNAGSCQFTLSITGDQSSALAIDDQYYGLVSATVDGTPYPIAAFYLPTLPAPGSQDAASPPDLVTLPYAVRLLGSLNLTAPQWEAIPDLITASSDAIRSWCHRDKYGFEQQTVVEYPYVDFQSGLARLSLIPVNYVERVQGQRSLALSLSNSTADTAWAYAVTTGDLAGGQTVTGLSLNWEITGAQQSATITFSSLSDQRISTLATAINAVGNGWSATASTSYGDWPISELAGLLDSAACGPNDNGGYYHIYARNIQPRFVPDDGMRTGMIWVGRLAAEGAAARWGPGGEELFGEEPFEMQSQVKVTYNGGFATIPRDLQLACVELAKMQLGRLKTDLELASEHGDKFDYTLGPEALMALPRHVLQTLARYKVTNG